MWGQEKHIGVKGAEGGSLLSLVRVPGICSSIWNGGQNPPTLGRLTLCQATRGEKSIF